MAQKGRTRRTRRRYRRRQKGGTNYPWAIVQYDDRALSEVDTGLMNRNKHYADKWGYEHIFVQNGYEDVSPYWRKVFVVKDILNSNKYRGVLWLDTDAALYNMEIDLNGLVEEGKHFYKSRDATPMNGGFCAGVWFVLNTPTGKEILSKWGEKYNPAVWRKNNSKWKTNGTWAGSNYEQGSFIENIIPAYKDVLKDYHHQYLQATDPSDQAFILHFYFTKERRRNFLDNNPLPMVLSVGKKPTRRLRWRQKGGNPPALVFIFSALAGFGSVVNVMIHAIKQAKETGREFYLKDTTWDDGPLRRWHDGFKTLRVYNRELHGEAEEAGHPKFVGMKEYTMTELSEIAKEILVPKDELLEKAKEFTESIGGPYTSIYMRRGDKLHGCRTSAKEMELISTPDLLKEFGILDDGRSLFIMTDDYTAVDEVKKELPSCNVFTLTPETNRGLTQNAVRGFSPEERTKQADELVTSIQVFLNGEKGWADNRSNMGRLLKLAAAEKVHLYPVSGHEKELKGETLIWPSWRELGHELK